MADGRDLKFGGCVLNFSGPARLLQQITEQPSRFEQFRWKLEA